MKEENEPTVTRTKRQSIRKKAFTHKNNNRRVEKNASELAARTCREAKISLVFFFFFTVTEIAKAATALIFINVNVFLVNRPVYVFI